MLHESIKEWNRWRNDMPMRYSCVADMPMLVAIGFEYLCNKYGKTDTAQHEAGHEILVAQMKAEIDKRAPRV